MRMRRVWNGRRVRAVMEARHLCRVTEVLNAPHPVGGFWSVGGRELLWVLERAVIRRLGVFVCVLFWFYF